MVDYPVETLLDTRFIKVFDLQYAPGRHYYNATRRSREEMVAAMGEAEFHSMVPDAVSLCVVWHGEGEPERAEKATPAGVATRFSHCLNSPHFRKRFSTKIRASAYS